MIVDDDSVIDVQASFLGQLRVRQDPDADDVSNLNEILIGTNPLNSDSDFDATPDGDEDADADGLPNALEEDLGNDLLDTDSDDDGTPDYDEDSEAETDMNVVMNEAGRFIEVQGTAEGHAFTGDEFDAMIELAGMRNAAAEAGFEGHGRVDFERFLLGATTDHLQELRYVDRKRIHNLKYYTWVEQQGKTYEEIQAQWYDEDYWTSIQAMADPIDELIVAFNERVGE